MAFHELHAKLEPGMWVCRNLATCSATETTADSCNANSPLPHKTAATETNSYRCYLSSCPELAQMWLHAARPKRARGRCNIDSEQWISSEECNVIITFVQDDAAAVKNLDVRQWGGWHCTNWAICQPQHTTAKVYVSLCVREALHKL